VNYLLILGVNILVISVLVAIYGVLIGDGGLVGIGFSISLVGGVLIVYSATPQDPSLAALANYSDLLVNSVTSILEDLDLLESQLCSVKRGESILLVYSKTPCLLEVDPGVGFAGGSPYLALPVNVLNVLVESFSESTNTLLERTLIAILVGELSACRSVKVEVENGFYRVYITGLTEVLKKYLERPVDPYTLLVLAISSAALRAECIRLVERRIISDGVLLVLKAESSGAES